MPSVTLHLVLADRVLTRWQENPGEAPFDPCDPSSINAFYQGSFGPDLGYFPGGHRLLSDLSHLVRSGDLTRDLVSRAETEGERAFAWGWAAHVLADQAIHPLVGRAVGELLWGDREIFADGNQHQVPHVQVETGLDAFYSQAYPEIRRRRMAPVFDGDSIRFLVEAYRRIYALRMGPSVFLSSHLASVRLSVQGLMAIGVLATPLMAKPTAPGSPAARWILQGALALMRMGLRRDSVAMAFLTPTPPAPWLVERVNRQVEAFSDRFHYHYETDLNELENFNLDTGEIQEDPPTHLGTLRTLRALAREGGTVFTGPGSLAA